MNLYLRLIWLLLRLPWMKKLKSPLDIAHLKMRVMPNDLDIYMHVNNGRYLTIMDLGRLHLMSVTRVLKHTQKNKWYPLLGSAKVHFIRSLECFNKFTMTTQVIYWDEKWIYVEQKIYKKEQLCVTALFKILFVGSDGKIEPKRLLEFVPNVPETPPIPHSVKVWQEAERLDRENSLK